MDICNSLCHKTYSQRGKVPIQMCNYLICPHQCYFLLTLLPKMKSLSVKIVSGNRKRWSGDGGTRLTRCSTCEFPYRFTSVDGQLKSRTGDYIWCICSLFNALVQTQTHNCNGFLKHSIYLNPRNDCWSLGIYPGAQKKIGIIKSGLHKITHDDVIICRRFLHYWPFVEIHCWTTVPLHNGSVMWSYDVFVWRLQPTSICLKIASVGNKWNLPAVHKSLLKYFTWYTWHYYQNRNIYYRSHRSE